MTSGLVIARAPERRHTGKWLTALVMSIGLISYGGWTTYQWYTTGAPLPLDIPIARADPAIDESDVPQSAVESYTVPSEHPRYINIPALGISDTRVFPVGVTAQNVLDTPRNIHDTAWYTKSVTPGTGYGAILIDGHNGGMTKNGIFAALNRLKQGDEIMIERGDGNHFTYQVVENQTMSLEDVNKTGMKMMQQSADPTKEGLNLITCAGKWVPRLGQFDARVMIRAVAK